MAKKKTARTKARTRKKASSRKPSPPKARAAKTPTPKSFGGMIRGRTKPVPEIAQALRAIVYEELPEAEESFYGGINPMAMYRTMADVCWIQVQRNRCNLYFVRGPELTDPDGILEGSSDRMRHAKVGSVELIEELPILEWLRESVELNEAEISGGLKADEVLEKVRKIGLALPNTKETITWGKPHLRVGEKIFCGCAEISGRPILGLKMERNESIMLMKVPGVEKAPYSRPNDGWVTIDPNTFDDWDEIERLVVGSYRLIAPKRLVAQLDAGGS